MASPNGVLTVVVLDAILVAVPHDESVQSHMDSINPVITPPTGNKIAFVTSSKADGGGTNWNSNWSKTAPAGTAESPYVANNPPGGGLVNVFGVGPEHVPLQVIALEGPTNPTVAIALAAMPRSNLFITPLT